MTIKTFDSHQARNSWREVLDAALIRGTDVIITRYNKPVVTMLAYEDYLAVKELLTQRRAERLRQQLSAESIETMIASESVLAREWNTPEEDAAWANL